MLTWAQFTTAVRVDLPVDSQRIGIATGTPNYLDSQLLHAVVELQTLIPYYQLGHETVYGPDDVILEGLASVGSIPFQAKPQDAYYKRTGKQCVSQPLATYDWGNRYDLVCGNPRITSGQFLIAINPQGTRFTVFPRITTDHQVNLFWNGVKKSFADADLVPFDDDFVQAVALFVSSELSRKVDHDLPEHQSYDLSYRQKRQLLYADAQEFVRLNLTAASPRQTDRCANSLAACRDNLVPDEIAGEDTVEFCAFGDSGDAALIANTEAVANLVKSLEPDLLVQMGDINYPHGDPVTFQDNFIKYYGLYVPTNVLFAFGNHDIETDGGIYLDSIFTKQAALNAGKRYYDYIFTEPSNINFPDQPPREIAHIFVLDSNDPNGCLPGTEQGDWLQPLLASSAMWNIVIFHEPPYTSDLSHSPGNPVMRAPFKTWGADIVLSAHGHNYERLLVDGFPYIVCGLGGAQSRGFTNPPITGSQFRYNTYYGTLWVTARPSRLQVSFFATTGDEIDSISLETAVGQLTP